MTIAKPTLPPIEVTVKDTTGNPIPGAHVRATYTYSGLSSDTNSAEDGTATVPLLYCDKEPMRVEAVAPGYQAETVSEYQPNREDYKLPLTLPTLKSEWEQITIPLGQSADTGSTNHPTLGSIQVIGNNFKISKQGDVSVNGSVSTRHSITLNQDYNLLMLDGTELTIRFLEHKHNFSITLEYSPPKQHSCAA